MKLRDYQSTSVSAVMGSLSRNEHPCLMLPTGTGKSVVIAALCFSILQSNPSSKILMVTHVKELIEQNAKRLGDYWREVAGYSAPMGVISAGLRRSDVGRAVTYAGIQSIGNKLDRHPPDYIIVDEAHLIPTSGEGRYRQLFAKFPSAKRIGMTATPWRLGSGEIVGGEGSMFTELLQPPGTSVREMVDAGYLAPLRSKHTDLQLSTLLDNVHTRGGEYVEAELEAAVNVDDANGRVAAEIALRGAGRKHWLVFCVSVAHAQAMALRLDALGHKCGVVHGGMSSLERTDALTRFRTGEYRALANVNVLTTGYDFPDLDLIAFVRPTLSPTLYAQMAGRGMRLKSGGPGSDCSVLDFAGLVRRHGPITDVNPPKKKGEKRGECPIKVCPECSELVHLSVKECPSCKYVWPESETQHAAQLHNDDIMAEVSHGVGRVDSWSWSIYNGKSGSPMLRIDYRFREPVRVEDRLVQKASEFLTVWHPEPGGGWARKKAERLIKDSRLAREVLGSGRLRRDLMASLCRMAPPESVKVEIKDGWPKVSRHKFAQKEAAAE